MILLFGLLGNIGWIAGGVLGFGGLAWLAFSNPLVMAFLLKHKELMIGLVLLFACAYFFSDYRSMQKEISVLKSDNSKWEKVNEQRNQEVKNWKELSERESAKVEAQEAINRQNEKDAAEHLLQLAKIKWSGDCKADVATATKEFARMAKEMEKRPRSAP